MHFLTVALALLLAAVHLVHASPVDNNAVSPPVAKGIQFYTFSGSFLCLNVENRTAGSPVFVSACPPDFPGWISPPVNGGLMRLAGTNMCLDAGVYPRIGQPLRLRRCSPWHWEMLRTRWFGRSDNFLRDALLEVASPSGGHTKLCARAGHQDATTKKFSTALARCNAKDVNQMWTSQQHG